MIAPARWVWAFLAAWVEMFKTTGRLLTTRWGIVFALLVVAIVVAQVAAR